MLTWWWWCECVCVCVCLRLIPATTSQPQSPPSHQLTPLQVPRQLSLSLDYTQWAAPAQPPSTTSTPSSLQLPHDPLSLDRTRWADPAQPPMSTPSSLQLPHHPLSLDHTLWAAPAQPPSTMSTPSPLQLRHNTTSSPSCGSPPNRTQWAVPAPLPNMLTPQTPPAVLGHHRPQSALPQQPYPLLSPIYQPNPDSLPCDLDLTFPLSPLPPPSTDQLIEPYPNNQLNVLNDIYQSYPHLNYSYLYYQYAPLSYLKSRNLL